MKIYKIGYFCTLGESRHGYDRSAVHDNKNKHFYMVMIDYFSKFIKAVPLHSIDAKSVTSAFIDYFVYTYSIPFTCYTDQLSDFESTLIICICNDIGNTKVYKNSISSSVW
ncbi:hypothetical protein RF11_14470 [Thelohanellus kitauei]|uniref:Integrase catalytic domain-containing protein n=1 Tax=Thelohanellus kitauei TaxID=669202 RepID=A0A0C2JL27_THEKT|nr:hypothetical protein RF11_14470 [Thelohanellus kitauei]